MTNIEFFDYKTKLSNTPYTQQNVWHQRSKRCSIHKQTFLNLQMFVLRTDFRLTKCEVRRRNFDPMLRSILSLSCKTNFESISLKIQF